MKKYIILFTILVFLIIMTGCGAADITLDKDIPLSQRSSQEINQQIDDLVLKMENAWTNQANTAWATNILVYQNELIIRCFKEAR